MSSGRWNSIVPSMASWSRCCVAADDGVVVKVYAAPCGQMLLKKKKRTKKSQISLLGELPSAKFEKKRKIGFNLIFSPLSPLISGQTKPQQ